MVSDSERSPARGHNKPNAKQSPLGRSRGSGSAHQGTHHWLVQRATSVALVFLGLWLVYSLMTKDFLNGPEMMMWLKSPMVAALMTLTLGVSLYHGYLGLQVVIEDYIHCEAIKIATLWTIKGVFLFLGVAVFYALISLQMRGFPIHV